MFKVPFFPHVTFELGILPQEQVCWLALQKYQGGQKELSATEQETGYLDINSIDRSLIADLTCKSFPFLCFYDTKDKLFSFCSSEHTVAARYRVCRNQ